MARPPKPEGEKYKSITISVRPEDVRVLQRLTLEIFSREVAKAGVAGTADELFERGERPSVSAAIRYLIDAERSHRTVLAHHVWSNLPSDKRPVLPPLDDLLAVDFSFSNGPPPATTEEKAFAEAYGAALAQEILTNEGLLRGVEASAKRGADKLTQTMASLQSDRPKPKRKRR